MIVTLIFALLPILVTIGLGFIAGRSGRFEKNASKTLVDMVMNYALPLSIFSGILGVGRDAIIKNIPLALWLVGGMVGCYAVVYLIQRYILHQEGNTLTVLRSLSISDPSVPFIGSAILPLLFSEGLAALDIGISTLIINIIMLPYIFAVLSKTEVSAENNTVGARFKKTLSKPIVIAALAGFILALFGVQMPAKLLPTFQTLGRASGGVAMFATGLILSSRKMTITKPIVWVTLSKNIFFPLVMWGLMALAGVNPTIMRIAVVTLSIPTATMPTNLAIQYQVGEQEMASIQMWSTVLSFITLSAFMLLLS